MTLPAAPTAASQATMEILIETFHADRQAIALATRRTAVVEIANVGRADLPRLFAACGFTRGAEVGVMRGEFSDVLCKGMPGLEQFYCVDPWITYDRYGDFKDQRKLNANFKMAQDRLAPYPFVTFLRQFSVDAAKTIPDGSLDFCFLDGNHEFSAVADDLFAWTPKIRSGGIISGHDFYIHKEKQTHLHVAECVTAWCDAYQIVPLMVLGRRACDVPGEVRDRPRSWMYVNI